MADFFKRLNEKTIMIFFFLASIYGFFVFRIESSSGQLTARIIIGIVFLIIIYFRYIKKSLIRDEENKVPRNIIPQENDIEIINRLGEEFHIQKKSIVEADFESYLKNFINIINSTFVASAAVYLFDQGENKLIPKGIHSFGKHKIKEIDTDIEIICDIFDKKEVVLKKSISEDEVDLFVETDDKTFKSFLGAPILLQKEVIGVLVVLSGTDEAFGEDDKKLIKHFSEVIEKTIENYNNLFEYETSSQLFSSFYEISKELYSNLKYDEIIEMLLSISKKIFKYDRISVSITEDNGFSGKIKRVEGQTDEFGEGHSFSLNDGLNGWVMRKNKPITVPNIEKGDYFMPRYSKSEKSNYELKSFLSAPIGYYNKCLGAVTIESKLPNQYEERHERVLVMLANNIGAALERSIIYQKLEAEATTDELTGLHNYRAFRLKLNEEINRAKRYRQTFCLLMMDIDKFKVFNDNYGHLVGDHILKAISDSITDSLRNIDFTARYGGEEFVAIVITSNIEDAIISAERIRSNIDKTKFQIDGSEYHITISIGVAEYPSSAETEDDLINKADKALYQAKAAGRNKAVVYREQS